MINPHVCSSEYFRGSDPLISFMRIRYNSPVILTFSIVVVLVQLVDTYLVPEFTETIFLVGGTISLINPNLKIYRNKIAKFNLGDSSLASVVGVNSYSSHILSCLSLYLLYMVSTAKLSIISCIVLTPP